VKMISFGSAPISCVSVDSDKAQSL